MYPFLFCFSKFTLPSSSSYLSKCLFVVYFINQSFVVGSVLTLLCTFSLEILFIPLALVPMLIVKSPESTYLAQISVLCYKSSLGIISWIFFGCSSVPFSLPCTVSPTHQPFIYTTTFKASILTAVVIVLLLLL